VVVRQCTATDAAQLVAREPASRGYANGALARQRAGLTDFLVALVDGVVVGSGELTTGQPAQLKSLAVEAPARGHGVGSAIIGAAEAIVAERVTFAGTGHRQLVLGVGLDNQRARALYERLGYVRSGVVTTTSYEYVDNFGVTRTATETDEDLVKTW